MKRQQKSLVMYQIFEQDSQMAHKLRSWKRKRPCPEEEVILISSDDDDINDCGAVYISKNKINNDDVILISDDSDISTDTDLPDRTIYSTADKMSFPKKTLLAIKKEKSSKECSDLSDDSSDLPDLPKFTKTEKDIAFEINISVHRKEPQKKVSRRERCDLAKICSEPANYVPNTEANNNDFILISDESDVSTDTDLPDRTIYSKADKMSLSKKNLLAIKREKSSEESSDLSDDSSGLPDLPKFTKTVKEISFESNMSVQMKDFHKNVSSRERCDLAEICLEPANHIPNTEGTDLDKKSICREKIDTESSIIKKHQVDVNIVKRNMFNSMMLGSFKGMKATCSVNPKLCVCIHKNKTAVHTGIMFQSIIETQIDNAEKLQSFAMRLMLRTVSSEQYLNLSLADLLVKVLVGSREGLLSIHDFHIGMSILMKQLVLHPPCRQQMRDYYLKLSANWFEKLLDHTEEVLENVQIVQQEEVEKENNSHTESSLNFYDLASVARKKERERQQVYLTQSKKEKLERINILLKFFIDLFKCNTSVWLVKHWSIKSCPFRQDISPIISRITWKTRYNFGCINQTIKKIFRLFSKTSEEKSLNQLFGDLVSLYATIVARKEKACIPHMGPLSRDFVESLFQEIKHLPKLVKVFSTINPDWVKFHIISLHLGVDQPPNFYKMREIIVKTLKDIQGGRFIGSPSTEKMCYEAIRSMLGMLELKSAVPPNCVLRDRVMEDPDLWFKESLRIENISEHIKHIDVALEGVKDETEIFYGFE